MNACSELMFGPERSPRRRIEFVLLSGILMRNRLDNVLTRVMFL